MACPPAAGPGPTSWLTAAASLSPQIADQPQPGCEGRVQILLRRIVLTQNLEFHSEQFDG